MSTASIYDDIDEEEETTNINLTNQLIGEVQAFTYIIRWFMYEFYQFKVFK